MRSLVVVLSIAVSACSGSPPPAPVDAEAACTKATYDLCNTEHDCTTMMCQDFMTAGFQVCTQVCSATAPCPNDSSGNAGTCTAMAVCQPAAANHCHL